VWQISAGSVRTHTACISVQALSDDYRDKIISSDIWRALAPILILEIFSSGVV
jgi:hypothetical protein